MNGVNGKQAKCLASDTRQTDQAGEGARQRTGGLSALG